ncbi:MAG: SDR family oxidoreductase [Calditrichia bacterium]
MKIALVTGATRGIGFEICRQLQEYNITVILAGRNKDDVEKKAALLGENVLPCQMDVTSSEDIKQVARLVEDKFGKLDILINNAGIGVGKSDAANADMEEVKKIFNTNFFGAWEVIVTFLPLLKKSEDPRIINISSGMGEWGSLTGGYAGYRLSKTALNALTVLLSNELTGTNVKINSVCPGWVRTDMGGPGAPGSVEQGADTPVWLATADHIPTGKFFRNRKEITW